MSLFLSTLSTNPIISKIREYKKINKDGKLDIKFPSHNENNNSLNINNIRAMEEKYKIIYKKEDNKTLLRNGSDFRQNHKQHENSKINEYYLPISNIKSLANNIPKERFYINKKYIVKGNKSCLEFSYKEDMNIQYKTTMEDKSISTTNFRNKLNESVFCLFDGHGGDEVSNYLQSNIINCYKEELSLNNNHKLALKNTFNTIDLNIKSHDYNYIGSTGTVIHLIKNSASHAIIYSANIGDSRAYIFTPNKYKMLTYDHRASDTSEKNRIIKSGGTIINNRVNGQLMLTRSFGDFGFKYFGVSAIPYISETNIDLSNKMQYLIIACDGVWDVLDEQYIQYIIKKHPFSSDAICDDIIKSSIHKGTWDNLSVFVIRLS